MIVVTTPPNSSKIKSCDQKSEARQNHRRTKIFSGRSRSESRGSLIIEHHGIIEGAANTIIFDTLYKNKSKDPRTTCEIPNPPPEGRGEGTLWDTLYCSVPEGQVCAIFLELWLCNSRRRHIFWRFVYNIMTKKPQYFNSKKCQSGQTVCPLTVWPKFGQWPNCGGFSLARWL